MATPPTVAELGAAGIPADVIDAAGRAGAVVRIAPDLVLHPDVLDRAVATIAARGDDGTSVSQLREALGTSRKYAVPLVEWMDANGVTVRRGDLRVLRPDDPR
jgi:selenocysteine-specific elongation factor